MHNITQEASMLEENQDKTTHKEERINFLCHTMQGGGLERVVSEIATYFEGTYRTQTFVLRKDRQRYPLPTPPILLSHCELRTSKLDTFKMLLESTIQYSIYLLKQKPALSMSFGGSTDWVNMVSCLFTRTPCITSFHHNPSKDKDRQHPSLARDILQHILNKGYRYISKYTVATSEGIRTTLLNDFHFDPEKVVTIYNPINTKEIDLKKDEKVIEEIYHTNLPIILSVGWLYHIKGQWHLIRVFAEIQKILPSKLVICGVGHPDGQDYTDKYHSLVSKLGLEDKVYFAGWQENPYKYMKNSTVFVHPSLSESFSNVVAEALACGVPVVASDCDFGPREILDNGEYGLLCTCSEWEYLETEPLTDAEQDMMDKILLLLADEELRAEYTLKGLERVKEFDTSKSMEKYGELFQKVIKP